MKLVIVVRTDVGMPLGKIIAQCAHAAQEFLISNICEMPPRYGAECYNAAMISLTREQLSWVKEHKRRKICLEATSEEELNQLYLNAQDAGLNVHQIVDAGLTHFSKPTLTCIAIGPHSDEKIDPITSHLKPLIGKNRKK